jgi:hypothetical protein
MTELATIANKTYCFTQGNLSKLEIRNKYHKIILYEHLSFHCGKEMKYLIYLLKDTFQMHYTFLNEISLRNISV